MALTPEARELLINSAQAFGTEPERLAEEPHPPMRCNTGLADARAREAHRPLVDVLAPRSHCRPQRHAHRPSPPGSSQPPVAASTHDR